jgi:hypothetical protein
VVQLARLEQQAQEGQQVLQVRQVMMETTGLLVQQDQPEQEDLLEQQGLLDPPDQEEPQEQKDLMDPQDQPALPVLAVLPALLARQGLLVLQERLVNQGAVVLTMFSALPQVMLTLLPEKLDLTMLPSHL